jgi:hypothetical protein
MFYEGECSSRTNKRPYFPPSFGPRHSACFVSELTVKTRPSWANPPPTLAEIPLVEESQAVLGAWVGRLLPHCLKISLSSAGVARRARVSASTTACAKSVACSQLRFLWIFSLSTEIGQRVVGETMVGTQPKLTSLSCLVLLLVLLLCFLLRALVPDVLPSLGKRHERS